MNEKDTMKPIEVLMVEDNPGDVRLTKEAFIDHKLRVNFHVVDDGEKAINYLHQKGEYSDASRADLILLDLNLPKMDGREVLARIKNDPNLKRIPVVILTTSLAEEDILKAYNLNANCYISKPVDFEKFMNVVKVVEDFWLTIVTLPME